MDYGNDSFVVLMVDLQLRHIILLLDNTFTYFENPAHCHQLRD